LWQTPRQWSPRHRHAAAKKAPELRRCCFDRWQRSTPQRHYMSSPPASPSAARDDADARASHAPWLARTPRRHDVGAAPPTPVPRIAGCEPARARGDPAHTPARARPQQCARDALVAVVAPHTPPAVRVHLGRRPGCDTRLRRGGGATSGAVCGAVRATHVSQLGSIRHGAGGCSIGDGGCWPVPSTARVWQRRECGEGAGRDDTPTSGEHGIAAAPRRHAWVRSGHTTAGLLAVFGCVPAAAAVAAASVSAVALDPAHRRRTRFVALGRPLALHTVQEAPATRQRTGVAQIQIHLPLAVGTVGSSPRPTFA